MSVTMRIIIDEGDADLREIIRRDLKIDMDKYNAADNKGEFLENEISLMRKDISKTFEAMRYMKKVQETCDHEFRPSGGKWSSATETTCYHCGLRRD